MSRFGWRGAGAWAARRWAYLWIVAAAVVAQLAVLALIRLHAADPGGGDLCRDAVTTRRLLAGQNPYTPIASCFLLRHTPHPPAWLLLIAPFGMLPVAWAAALWDLLGLAALATALALVIGELRLRQTPWRAALALAFVVSWPPLLGTLLEAQVSPVLLLLFTAAWRQARRGRGGDAGVALGLATALRLFPALLVLYFAARRDWRAVLAAALSFAVPSLLLLPVIGWQGYLAFATREAPASTADWIAHPHNTSLAGLAYHFVGVGHFPASAPLPVSRLATVALLALLLARTLLRRHVPFRFDEATFLAYIPAAMLVSPLMWTHYYVVLLLPLALLAARLGWLGTTPEAPSPPPATHDPRGLRRHTLIGWLVAVAVLCVWAGYTLAFATWPATLRPAVDALPSGALLATFAALLLADAPSHAGHSSLARDVPHVA